MALQLFKEMFDGKYDSVTPPTLLPVGWISGGQNMRKVSTRGGWKPRKGSILHNTTQVANAQIYTLHQYTHPRNADYHFLIQCNSNIYDSTNDPPTAGTTYGSSIYASASTTAGFGDTVGEHWFYADGGSVITWGGDNPFPIGFLVYDTATAVFTDYSRVVVDANSATLATITAVATTEVYVCSPEIASGITFDLTAVNADATVATLYSWVAGAWSDRSATDGTIAVAGKSMSGDGAMTWARNATDAMTVIAGMMGYWYKIVWSNAFSAAVTAPKVTLVMSVMALTNKWDGIPQWPTGVRFYDQSVDQYEDVLGKTSNESTSTYIDMSSATTSDYIYIKTPEPATGFGFGVPDGYANATAGNIDLIEYWDGDSWNSVITDGVTALTDETLDGAGDSSFAASGWVWFNGPKLVPKRRKLLWDPVPGFWYRVSWDADLTADTRVYTVVYAPSPEALPSYDGCVQFKDRLFLWGDPEYPNRLRYSAKGKPDCFCGADSGYTDAFGDMSKVVCCKRFYNELAVFKKTSIWLLEGNSPETFGKVEIADTVGAASPQSVCVSEAGYPSMHSNEVLSILIWQDTDGVYVLDGRKPKKISLPINNIFNPESSDCIATTYINTLQAFMDRTNCEYHLIVPAVATEYVYNYITDEWFPKYVRAIALTSGICLRGTDGRYYTYGGCSTGYVFKLETNACDKNTSDADTAITHYVKTRGICAKQDQASSFYFTFRNLYAELKAQSAGTVIVETYRNGATSGTNQAVPSAMSMVSSGYNYAFPELDISIQGVMMMQLYFGATTLNWSVEIYSFLYSLEVRGVL